MEMTPSQAFDQEEALAQYLQTQYRICHPAVFAERGEMLRWRGTIAQTAFIEATATSYKAASWRTGKSAPVSQHKLPSELRGEIKLGAFSQTTRSPARCLTGHQTTRR